MLNVTPAQMLRLLAKMLPDLVGPDDKDDPAQFIAAMEQGAAAIDRVAVLEAEIGRLKVERALWRIQAEDEKSANA